MPMSRCDFPKQVLRDGVLIGGINLLKYKSARNAFVLAAKEFLVPHDSSMCVNRSCRKAHFHRQYRPLGHRGFLRERKSIAVQVARKPAPDNTAAAGNVISEQDRNIQAMRKPVRVAQFLVA